MKVIKNILGRIFALWAAVIFVITLLPVVLIIWISGVAEEPKRTAILINIFNVWMSFFLFVTGCRLKIKGRENFKKNEVYIIICNHNFLMDIIVATPFIPGPNKTIAKIELANIPLFGLIYKRGSVLVDRKNKDSRRESLEKMKQVLAKGIHMCIYPEGTRNRTDQPLKEFHSGAFRLAVDTGKPILPAVLFNTKKASPPNKTFYFWPTTFEMHFLPPVEVSPGENAEELKMKMHDLMSSYYISNNN